MNPEYIIDKPLTAGLIKSYCSFAGPWPKKIIGWHFRSAKE